MKKILFFAGMVLTVFALSGCGSSKGGTFTSIPPAATSGPEVNSSTASTRSGPPIVNPAAFKKHGSLAFVCNGLLYDLDGTTGQVRQLTMSGRVIHPVWSPDGRWLAYILTTPDDDSAIPSTDGTLWLVRRDGTRAHQVEGLTGPVTNDDYHTTFAWSPSADVLAVAGAHGLFEQKRHGSKEGYLSTAIKYLMPT